MIRSRLALAAAGALALTACSMDAPLPVSPVAASAAKSVAVSSRLLVLASPSGFGADFASQVASLGGTIVNLHAGSGLAVVSGVSDASKLAALSGVTDVEADAVVSLDLPHSATRADATSLGNPSASSAAKPATAAFSSWQWNMQAIHAPEAWAAGHLGNA